MAFRLFPTLFRLAIAGLAAAILSACTESDLPKDLRPVSYKLTDKMRAQGMNPTSPILIRIFKEESALEVWKQKKDGTYGLLKTYEICKWSGVLGPKIKEGDRQAPEGFYIVTPAQMNPKSSYYLSFNIGYPNAYDRSLGRTGTHLMVHGACSSSGCYSMTDQDAGELFGLARDAFKGGQTSFQIQAFPFRMTPENLARHRTDPNLEFWRMLKVGYDHFEVTRRVPSVDVCDRRYVFDADAAGAAFVATAKCPRYTVPDTIASAVAAKQAADDQKFAAAVAKDEANAAAAAAKQAKAQEAAAAKAAAEAAAAAKPPLLSRWFGRSRKPADAAPDGAETTGTTAAPAATPISVPAPEPRVRPATPIVEANAAPAATPPPAKPKKAGTAVAAPPGKPVVAASIAPPAAPTPAKKKIPAEATAGPAPAPVGTAAAAVATPPAAEPPPAAMEPIPGAVAAPAPAGQLVKRDFYWADDNPSQ